MSLFAEPVTIARKLTLACATRHIEVEIVAITQINGESCLVDAFFAPASHDVRRYGHPYPDPTFLEALKTALNALGFPAGALAYAARSAQDEHCVGFEGGPELAQAVLKHLADTHDVPAAA
jgi:hypothetical protein